MGTEYELTCNLPPLNDDNIDDYHLLGDDTMWLPEDDNHHSHRRGNLKSYNDDNIISSSVSK
jgi:hypothetical protein